MTNVENALLRQMQKMAASLGAMQGAVNKDKGNQAAVSFQEMMQQSGGKVSSKQPAKDAPAEKPVKGEEENLEEGRLPVEKQEEELKPENLAGNPNAVVMELFRPEIVEGAGEQAAEPILAAIPEETVQETAMDLEGQSPELETGVDAGVGAEVSMEQQPKDFGQAMEEAPVQQETTQPVQVRQEDAPEQAVEEVDKPDDLPDTVEVKVENLEEGEETSGESAAAGQAVFHETESVPVKVGERYETVDTQKPEMEKQLADVIRGAAQTGTERIQIHLAPQNLGSLVIEMTKDANGALQVVLHTSNAKAAGVLNQHLDGLHNALQSYGQEEVRVEVQRGQESQEQHFKQADPDGRGQHQQRQQQERHEEDSVNGQEFLQKLRLGLFGTDEL
ncbi:MAG: flagellar hook-length control protein FliK [Oscillospiraceae bacterium]|nr:flagellar hook-length control protein FliK [Oscillospiraceae bacterium]